MSFSVKNKMAALAVASIAAASAVSANAFTVTYEAPGAVNSTATFDFKGVEDFNSRATSTTGQNFTTNFGTTGMPVEITGVYTSVQIVANDVWGGAGNNGNYAATFSSTGYQLALSARNTSSSAAVPVTYFGFWLSALDTGNQLSFFRGNTSVFSYSPASVQGGTGTCPSSSYCGKPGTGANSAQQYVFLNFFDDSGLGFDRIVFTEAPQVGGYESDNHTVGRFLTRSGTQVPEPGSLALLGLGLVGLAVARKRKQA